MNLSKIFKSAGAANFDTSVVEQLKKDFLEVQENSVRDLRLVSPWELSVKSRAIQKKVRGPLHLKSPTDMIACLFSVTYGVSLAEKLLEHHSDYLIDNAEYIRPLSPSGPGDLYLIAYRAGRLDVIDRLIERAVVPQSGVNNQCIYLRSIKENNLGVFKKLYDKFEPVITEQMANSILTHNAENIFMLLHPACNKYRILSRHKSTTIYESVLCSGVDMKSDTFAAFDVLLSKILKDFDPVRVQKVLGSIDLTSIEKRSKLIDIVGLEGQHPNIGRFLSMVTFADESLLINQKKTTVAAYMAKCVDVSKHLDFFARLDTSEMNAGDLALVDKYRLEGSIGTAPRRGVLKV